METVHRAAEVRGHVRDWRRAGDRIAFVPTMGNLHEGHLTLIDLAGRAADRVVASVFVNPTQFMPGEDYDNYPRTFDADQRFLAQRGCDLLFAPRPSEVYPFGLEHATMMIGPSDISGVLEGAHRPGHFDGVVSVVSRLFNIVAPDAAVFGEKDYQQLLVMQRMSRDFGYDIEILPAPTNREEDGLAMSSRNAYLSAAERARAAAIHHTLATIVERLEAGQGEPAALEAWGREALEDEGFAVDYVAIRHADDLRPAGEGTGPLRVLVAARLGGTRLIDNLPVTDAPA